MTGNLKKKREILGNTGVSKRTETYCRHVVTVSLNTEVEPGEET